MKRKIASPSRRPPAARRLSKVLHELYPLAANLGLTVQGVNDKVQISTPSGAGGKPGKILCSTASATVARAFLNGARYSAERAQRPCTLCAELEREELEQRTQVRIVMACAYAYARWLWWHDDAAIAEYIREQDAQGPLQDVRTLINERARGLGLTDPYEPGGVRYLQPMPADELTVAKRWLVADETGQVQLVEALAHEGQAHLECFVVEVPGYVQVLSLTESTAVFIRRAINAWALAPTVASEQRMRYRRAA